MFRYALILLLAANALAVEKEKRGHVVTIAGITPDSLLNEADAIFQTKDHAKALEKYDEAATLAREEFNRSVEAEATAQMARMNLILGNREVGEVQLDQAALLTNDSDPMGWSRYLSVRGRYEWKDGKLQIARRTFDEMYSYCNTNALWGRAVDAANMLAIVSEKPEDQIEWSRRGIEAAQAGDAEYWLGPLWNNLAITYYDLKQFDTALECFTRAREYHWRFGGEVQKLFADYHVGMAYRSLGQFDEAGKWLRPVLAWAERLENHSAIGQTLEDLGEIEIAKGKKSEGLNLLKRARESFRKAHFEKDVPDAWKRINDRISQLGG